MAETHCPMCGRHCPADQLQCGRGRNYFQQGEAQDHHHEQHGPREERDISAMTPDEALMMLLRKCGHYLHHSVGHGEADTQHLFGALSDAEKQQLVALLDKCTKSWE